MYCRNCGKELVDGSKFCSNCGALINEQKEEVKEEKVEVIEDYATTSQTPKVSKVWVVFGKLAKIFGIVSISTCWIPILGLMILSISMPGIVFGALAMAKGKADRAVKSSGTIGMILSIVSTVLAFVFYILFIFLIVGLSMSSGDAYYYYY